MTRPDPRPASYVHGADGPVVVVPGRVAAWLERNARLREMHQHSRGADPEVDAVVVGLLLAARAWRASATGSADAVRPEVGAGSQELSTREAADLLHVTDRAIRQAITDGRLQAQRIGSRWVLQRENVEHYRAGRTAA